MKGKKGGNRSASVKVKSEVIGDVGRRCVVEVLVKWMLLMIFEGGRMTLDMYFELVVRGGH